MNKITVICPECHRTVVFFEQPGYQNMLLECPTCRFKANASVYQSGSQARGGLGADDVPTQLFFAPDSSVDIGQIRVLSSNEIQHLREGQNVIGRRAMSGMADIKISNDMTMSRKHIRIDVVKKKFGYEHRLVEIGSLNIAKLNGIDINRGDIIILKFGDRLTLGKTDIVIESNRDEATRMA